MKTAVEWLAEQMLYIDNEYDMKFICKNQYQSKRRDIINQAKEMENEQKKQYQLSIKCLIDFVDAVDSEKVILAEEYENAKRVINQFKNMK
jgi:capsular polysaccharide biosynthesis protein